MKDAVKIAISVGLIVAGYVIIGLRAFYPYHRFIALVLYIGSAMPLYMAAREKWNLVDGKKRLALRKRIRGYLPHIIVGIILFLCFKAAWVLVPIEPTLLTEMTDEELRANIDQDMKYVRMLRKNNEVFFQALGESGVFEKGVDDFKDADRELLKGLWGGYLTNVFELELVKNKYKGFYQVSYLSKKGLHSDAFFIALASLSEQYSSILKLIGLLEADHFLRAVINEANEHYPANSLNRISQRITNPDLLLQLNAGAGYMQLIKNDVTLGEDEVIGLERKIKRVFKGLGKNAKIFIDNPLEMMERAAFVSWYPIQKNVALQLSLIRTTGRGFFIPADAMAEYKKKLLPGDIMLERRNWFMSNIGIPGFWPHVALYIGSLEDIDKTFNGLDILKGKSASEFLMERFPEACESLNGKDGEGFSKNVIEALKDGCVMTSVEHSGSADYLAVLRPRLSLEEKFIAIVRAFGYWGRPYDYNFDFATDNELVCSELVYKSYQGAAGLNLEPVMMNGRPILPPNLIVQKFDERNGSDEQMLDFVLYLEGSEEKQRFFERDVTDFRKTWKLPKWDIMQE